MGFPNSGSFSAKSVCVTLGVGCIQHQRFHDSFLDELTLNEGHHEDTSHANQNSKVPVTWQNSFR